MTMTSEELASRKLFTELAPGDHVSVRHTVKVGLKSWNTQTEGMVVETRRRRHGLHSRRNNDDKVYSDIIVLRLSSGELTTVTMDEYTLLERISA